MLRDKLWSNIKRGKRKKRGEGLKGKGPKKKRLSVGGSKGWMSS